MSSSESSCESSDEEEQYEEEEEELQIEEKYWYQEEWSIVELSKTFTISFSPHWQSSSEVWCIAILPLMKEKFLMRKTVCGKPFAVYLISTQQITALRTGNAFISTVSTNTRRTLHYYNISSPLQPGAIRSDQRGK
jgi:hypothetical protein